MLTHKDPYGNASYLTSQNITSNQDLMNACAAEYYANRSGPWTAGPPDGDAFPSLPAILNGSTTISDEAQAQNTSHYLAEGADASVMAGYEAQHKLLVTALGTPSRAAYELINTNYGGFSMATMRPFSRGTITVSINQFPDLKRFVKLSPYSFNLPKPFSLR